MSYMHIDLIYKAQDILLFRECYAMEKIHGSSSSVSYNRNNNPKIRFFSGGESQDRFEKLFDAAKLETVFDSMGVEEVTIFGEVYGGSCQGMSYLYGKELKFVAFDVL